VLQRAVDADVSEEGAMAEPACEFCGPDTRWTPPITVIVVALPDLPKRYPLIPEFEDNYRVCLHCKSLWRTVDKAVASNKATADAGTWTEALVICQDLFFALKNTAARPAVPANA
jgi:hypothetical protein